MAEELKKLVKQRGFIKADVTRFITFLAKFEIDKDYIELEHRLSLVIGDFDKFKILQDQIELIDEDTNSESHNDERQNFEDLYFKSISKAKKHLKSVDARVQSGASGTSRWSDNGTDTAALMCGDGADSGPLTQIKLPIISLPEFAGSYSQWTHFYETFNSLIHDRTNLSNIQKFYYLKSCLQGEAAQLLYSLEITNETYTIAWEMLKGRYENKKVIIHTHVKAIFDLYPIKTESHVFLRKLLDNLTKNLRALASLGLPTESWDALILYLIGSKLDLSTKLEWDKLTAKDVSPTIKQLTTFLSDRCQLLEASEVMVKNYKFQYKRDEKSLTHLSSTTQNITCDFCKQPHKNHQCGKFLKMSIDEKLAEVRMHKLCNNCLRPNHGKYNCRAGNCYKCKGRHNSLLYSVEHKQNVKDNKIESISNAEHETTIVNHSLQSSSKQILLATAMVYIKSNKTGAPVSCRALLDGGSQSSFLTYQIAEKLGLKLYNTQIKVVGINNTSSNIYKATKATIISNDQKHKFNETFLITHKITERIPQISFDCSSLNIPKNINLADKTFNKTGEVDILIGANIFYASLSNGQQRLNNDGLMLQNSLFGWVIIGPLTHNVPHSQTVSCNVSINNYDLHAQLEKFWLLEECTNIKKYTPEEIEVEKHFIDTYTRDKQGRFEVSLPIKDNISMLVTRSIVPQNFFTNSKSG